MLVLRSRVNRVNRPRESLCLLSLFLSPPILDINHKCYLCCKLNKYHWYRIGLMALDDDRTLNCSFPFSTKTKWTKFLRTSPFNFQIFTHNSTNTIKCADGIYISQLQSIIKIPSTIQKNTTFTSLCAKSLFVIHSNAHTKHWATPFSIVLFVARARDIFPDEISIFYLYNFIDAFVLHRASHNFWLIQIGFSVYSTSHNQMLYAFSLLLSSHQSFLLWLLLRLIGTKNIFFHPAADETLSIQSH